MKLAIILGTRPEIIKMSPIIRECEQRGLDHFILHTGQHYSYEMDRVFFEQLELPDAVKVARMVLRRGRASNRFSLFNGAAGAHVVRITSNRNGY